MPVIADDASWLFVHVPRTGGTSAALALPGKRLPRMHAPMRDLRGHGARFTFAFVRNPWDRLASWWYYVAYPTMALLRDIDPDHVRGIGFKRWLLDDAEQAWFHYEDRAALPSLQRRPQWWWVEGCSFVGRSEKLVEDFRRACRAGGIEGADTPAPRINMRVRPPYREEYDDESRAAVARWHAEDVARWGYRF